MNEENLVAKVPILDKKEAIHNGFRKLTYPYFLPAEHWMLEKALALLHKEKVCLVYGNKKGKMGVEIWRK